MADREAHTAFNVPPEIRIIRSSKALPENGGWTPRIGKEKSLLTIFPYISAYTSTHVWGKSTLTNRQKLSRKFDRDNSKLNIPAWSVVAVVYIKIKFIKLSI